MRVLHYTGQNIVRIVLVAVYCAYTCFMLWSYEAISSSSRQGAENMHVPVCVNLWLHRRVLGRHHAGLYGDQHVR